MGKTKSIVTECCTLCAICGRPKTAVHHLIFGSNRKLADKDGLTIPICNDCHNFGKYKIHENPTAEKLSKMLGQMAWEKQRIIEGYDYRTVRGEFRKRYGRSYL